MRSSSGKKNSGDIRKGGTRKRKPSRIGLAPRVAFKFAVLIIVGYLLWVLTGLWFSCHSQAWINQQRQSTLGPVCDGLLYIGDRTRVYTDALGWTGHDVVYETDDPAPEGRVFFAGAPKRIGPPAPMDICTLDNGDFVVGYSPSLHHSVWSAYHVPTQVPFRSGKRPGFRPDKRVRNSPNPGDYSHSGYDRGHMTPNYAIATRFGAEAQKQTFLMTNIVPQTPALNRGVWHRLELYIADLLTGYYGECWVIVGCVPSADRRTIPNKAIDIPDFCWMLVTAQTKEGVRVFAVVIPQLVDYDAFAFKYLVSVDELETLTGLDFFPEMPDYLQRPLEADHPTRLWPLPLTEVLRMVFLRFS